MSSGSPKLHFEKGFEAQSFLDTKSVPNSTYSAKHVFRILFLALIWNILFNRKIILG